jgi:hypothetical protein
MNTGLVTDVVGRLIRIGLVQEANALLAALIGAVTLGQLPSLLSPVTTSAVMLTSQMQQLTTQLTTRSLFASTSLFAAPAA